MSLRAWDRYTPEVIENENIKFTESGLMYKVDSATGVPYLLSPSLVPESFYLANVSQEPQTPSLPPAPPHHDDDPVPRSPIITIDPIPESGLMYKVDSATGVPYLLSASLVPESFYLANVSQEPKIPSFPPAQPHHDDDPVPRSPIITIDPIPEPTPPSGLLESRRILIYEKITPRKLLARVGLHCYYLQNGTNLQFWGLLMNDPKDTGIISGHIRDSTRDLELRVRYDEVERKRCSTMITTLCRLKPQQTPEVEGDLCAAFDRLSVDDFFKDDLPDWVPEDALTASDNLQYYEMKESEVEEYKDWLHLYAELGFFTTCGRFLEKLRWAQPFELRKVIVQTREHVESKKKAKAENAIFYIAFKTRSGRDYRVIIRRTMDGTPEHMSLEIKCLKMWKSTIMSN